MLEAVGVTKMPMICLMHLLARIISFSCSVLPQHHRIRYCSRELNFGHFTIHPSFDRNYLPTDASWTWGGGFSEAGFDFAGSGVHSVGLGSLAGAIVLGPRLGRYVDGKHCPLLGSNLPLATLGTFIMVRLVRI